MDVANYLIALKDGMSGPASAADGALRKLESTIRNEAAALSALDAKMLKQVDSIAALDAALMAAEQAYHQMQDASDGSKSAEAAIRKQGAAVASLEQQIRRANAAYDGMKEKADAKGANIASLKAAIPEYQKLSEASKASASAQAAHAAKMQGFADAAKGAKGATDQAGAATDMLKDKMPQLDGNLGKVQQALAKLGPVGVAVAAVFAIVVTAATILIGTLLKLAETAISVSQEKDALAATFKALSTGTESGRELVDSLSEVAAKLPFAEGKTLAWGKALMSAGIEGKGLEVAVRAAAAATAIMGEEGGAALISMEKQLAAGGAAADALIKTVKEGGKKAAVALSAMGVTADDLAKALKVSPEHLKTMTLTAEQLSAALEEALITKGAKSLELMGLTWKSITDKMHDAWEDLFEDLGSAVTPFMTEIKSLFAEFSAGGTAQGLTKSLLTAFFTQLFAIATKVTHAIHLGFLEIEIALLKVYIFMAPLINAFRQFAASEAFLTGLSVALKAIGILVLALLIPVAVITGGFIAFGTAVMTVVGAVIAALTWCVGDATRAGGEVINGFKIGLVNGASDIWNTMKMIASGAVSAFKSVLGIHSPSSVMRLQGQFTAQGAAMGIDDGAADVAAASGDMAQGAADAGSSRTVTAKGAGGNVYNIVQNFYGSAKSMAEEAEEAVRRVLENDANAEPMPEGA